MNKLSVGIPTYNGARTIYAVVSEIYKQAENDKIYVEIIISDNCSTDGTRQIIEKNFTSNDYCSLIYNFNEINIGFDANCDKCVQLSNNEYIWLCSDNEILCDNHGLLKIWGLLDKYSPEFLYLHHESELPFESSNEYYKNGEDYFIETNFSGGLISNCVIKTETWKSLNILRYKGSQWIHFAYQIEALSPKREKHDCCCLKDIIYTSLPSKERWGQNGSFIDTGIKLVELFYKNMPILGYNEDTIKKAKLVVKGGYPKNIIIARAMGYVFTKEMIDKMTDYFGEFKTFHKKDMRAIKMPIIFCKLYFYFDIYSLKLKRKIKSFLR